MSQSVDQQPMFDVVLDELVRSAEAGTPLPLELAEVFWTTVFDGVATKWAERDTQIAIDLAQFARPMMGERVLDIGCGVGSSTRAAAADVGSGGDVIGIDISAKMIEKAREELNPGNCEFEVRSGLDLDYPPDSFDLVLASLSLFFFGSLQAGLEQIAEVLAPHGRLVFSTPFAYGEIRLLTELDRLLPANAVEGLRLFEESTMRTAIDSAGFKVDEITTRPARPTDGLSQSVVDFLAKLATRLGADVGADGWASPSRVAFVSVSLR